MEASDLCLIIDNTQSYLRDWLGLSTRWEGKLTAECAELHFRFRMRATECPPDSLRFDAIALMCNSIDWQELADHYNTKVREGASC